jgi:hypothetical protein
MRKRPAATSEDTFPDIAAQLEEIWQSRPRARITLPASDSVSRRSAPDRAYAMRDPVIQFLKIP